MAKDRGFGMKVTMIRSIDLEELESSRIGEKVKVDGVPLSKRLESRGSVPRLLDQEETKVSFFILGEVGHVKRMDRHEPFVVHVHTWEGYVKTPKLELPLYKRLISYLGIRSTLGKVEFLLKDFRLGCVDRMLGLG
jgi:hypothetical protein